MTKNRFQILLETNRPILFDGAMGTMLNSRGIDYDRCFDDLNLSQPALVAEIHREYIEAGSQVIQTNTFGANRFKLSRHGLEDKVSQINIAAVELAKKIILASFKEVLLAGDIGPLGVRLAPFGRVQPEEAFQVFLEQATALNSAGVDLFIIETMTDLFEMKEAIAAVMKTAPGIPIIASMTFTRDDRTLLGDDPIKVASQIIETGVDVVGVNCSGGPSQLFRIQKQMAGAFPKATYAVMPNAGWPQQIGGRIMYPAGPDYFEEYALALWNSGVKVIGGCCGTTPRHIAAMRKALDRAPSQPRTDGSISITFPEPEEAPMAEQPTNLSKSLHGGKFVISVEMDPPRGLSTHKLIAGATLLMDSGADVINVADSPMARMRMSPWAVCNLIQRQVGIETVLHFPTRGRNLLRVQGDLLAAHALGVRNVFVVMGDPTSIGDYPDAMDDYDLVPSGLIGMIKNHFNLGIDHSGSDIGQPTSFFVGCALNLNPPNLVFEVKKLNRKIEAGADFILTQPFYDPYLFTMVIERYKSEFGRLETPILAGILPLANLRHAMFLKNEVPGIDLPEFTLERMRKNEEKGPREGINIALELIENLREHVHGLYIIPAFNRFDHVAEIIETSRKTNLV